MRYCVGTDAVRKRGEVMTVVIGDNHNLIADILSFIVCACLFVYVCYRFYKDGYCDGVESCKESEVTNEN